jgi:hypothetical protein
VGSGTLTNGTTTFSYDPHALPATTYSITATYLEDSNFTSSTSAARVLSVQDFQLAASPATVTIAAPGKSGMATLTIVPIAGFNQALNYTCSGLPSGATCTFTSATTETLAIQTTAASARLDRGPFGRARGLFYACLLPGFLGLVAGAGNRTRRFQGGRLLGMIVVLAVVTVWMTACAGISNGSIGSSSSNNNTHVNPGTPIGNYSVTVTAATSGPTPLGHSRIITLAVQ